MKPRITMITLLVSDLERAVSFYRDGLKLPTKGIVGREFEHGAAAFFELAGGLHLARLLLGRPRLCPALEQSSELCRVVDCLAAVVVVEDDLDLFHTARAGQPLRPFHPRDELSL